MYCEFWASNTYGAIHIWRQRPRGEGGLVKCWQNLTWGEGGFDQWWHQQKRIFCCNRNKWINKNTQPLNLNMKLISLKNLWLYVLDTIFLLIHKYVKEEFYLLCSIFRSRCLYYFYFICQTYLWGQKLACR